MKKSEWVPPKESVKFICIGSGGSKPTKPQEETITEGPRQGLYLSKSALEYFNLTGKEKIMNVVEKFCKTCIHAAPQYDTSREWGKKAVCFADQVMRSQVDGFPELTCKEQRSIKAVEKHEFEVCGFEGEWWEGS